MLKRLQLEYGTVQKNKTKNFGVTLVDNNIKHWRVKFDGPTDSPYEGGVFNLDIKFDDEKYQYPFFAPDIRFITKIYHPNVYESGMICMDILRRDEHSTWSPSQAMTNVILSIWGLICEPNPHSPVNHAIGQLFQNKRDQFDATAREWTQKYARPKPELSPKPSISRNQLAACILQLNLDPQD